MDSLKAFDILLSMMIGWLLHSYGNQSASSFWLPWTIDKPPEVVTVIKYFNTTIREEIDEFAVPADIPGLSFSTFIICALSALVLLLIVALGASHADTCSLAFDLCHNEFFGLSDDYTWSDNKSINYISTSTSTDDLPHSYSTAIELMEIVDGLLLSRPHLPGSPKYKDAGTSIQPYALSPESDENAQNLLSLPPLPEDPIYKDTGTQTVRTVKPILRFRDTEDVPADAPPSAPAPSRRRIVIPTPVPSPSGAKKPSKTVGVTFHGDIFKLNVASEAEFPTPMTQPTVALDFGSTVEFGSDAPTEAGPSGGYSLPGKQLTDASLSLDDSTSTDAVAEMPPQTAEPTSEPVVSSGSGSGVAQDGESESETEGKKEKKNKPSRRKRKANRNRAAAEKKKKEEEEAAEKEQE